MLSGIAKLPSFLIIVAIAACSASVTETAALPVVMPSLTVTTAKVETATPTVTETLALPIIYASSTPSQPPPQDPVVRFAVIGDYGMGGQPEADVASLVQSWEPDFIITTGDNNYPDGSSTTIDANVGQFYHRYIYPYTGAYGEGADQNRYYPTLGNHDWNTDSAQPYLDYFTLPGNERYYDFTWGPIHFFALDSDSREPDGVGQSSTQAVWLQNELANSTAIWKIVYMHHAPYSSGWHGSTDWAQWPYADWEASVVLAGHDHTYERLLIDGIPYFVNGLGGGSIYNFGIPLEGSQVRYNQDYGAMLVEASEESLTFTFANSQLELIDSFTLMK